MARRSQSLLLNVLVLGDALSLGYPCFFGCPSSVGVREFSLRFERFHLSLPSMLRMSMVLW